MLVKLRLNGAVVPPGSERVSLLTNIASILRMVSRRRRVEADSPKDGSNGEFFDWALISACFRRVHTTDDRLVLSVIKMYMIPSAIVAARDPTCANARLDAWRYRTAFWRASLAVDIPSPAFDRRRSSSSAQPEAVSKPKDRAGFESIVSWWARKNSNQ